MSGTQVRRGPRALDSKSGRLVLPMAPSGSNSFPSWDLGKEREREGKEGRRWESGEVPGRDPFTPVSWGP